jgi:ribosomal protein L11 methyltransferase
MAFGTGTHPSTQLCLALMEDFFQERQGRELVAPRANQISLIDVGCGSGILSIAALKLGAGAALAVDIDQEAILNARQNAKTNGIGPALTLGVGSVGDILLGRFSIDKATLVVANILAPVIISLLEEGLSQLVIPGGELILGGILEGQVEGVVKAGQAAGMLLKDQRRAADWVALAMSARGAPS